MSQWKIQLRREMLLTLLLIVFSVPAFAEVQEKTRSELTEVVVAFPREFPPQCFLNQKGEPTGFAIDVMNHVARLANLKVVYRPEKNWVDAANSLQNGVADLIPNSGITTKRLIDSDFTMPVETFDVVIFVRETMHDITSLDDLNGRKVAVLPMNVGRRIINERKNIIGVVYNEISTALFDMLAGKVDALIYPKPVVLKLAREAGIDNHIKIAGEPLVEIKRAIRVRKGDELLSRLNPAVEAFLRSADYQDIYTKWYGKPRPFWTTGKVLLLMSGVIVILFFVMFTWRYKSLANLNSKLNKKTIEQTKELLEREKRFRSLSEAAFEGIALSKKAIIIDANDALGRILGLDPSELIGKTVINFIAPESREDAINKIASGYEMPYESVCLRKDGKTFPAEICARMYSDDGEKMRVTVVRDVSERKREEEERERLIGELKQTLAEVKTLEGILPVCSYCKKIRNDNGNWENMDVYLQRFSEVDVSHGLCRDCMKSHNPQEYEALYGKKD